MPSHLSRSPTVRLPVLVLGGGITGLGILRTLARNRIARWLVAPPGDLAFASRHARTPPLSPRAPVAAEAEFPGWLRALPVEQAVLIPASDGWIRRISLLDQALRLRFPAAVSSPDVLDQAIDKVRFASLLGRIGVPHPRSWTLERTADLDSIPESAWAHAFLKPRESQTFFARYGVKGVWVRSRQEAAGRLGEILDHGLAVQLQEYVPGPPTAHVFVDGYAASGGEIRALLVRRRLRMYPPDFGNSTYMVTIPEEEAGDAVRAVERLIGALQFRGVFSVELKQSEVDGRYYAIEMNARPWWFVDYAARAGVDVVLLSWLDALGQPLPMMRAYQIGRRCIYPYYDWFAVSELRRRTATRWDWLRAIPGADQPVFRWSDPGPAIHAVQATIRAHRRAKSSSQ